MCILTSSDQKSFHYLILTQSTKISLQFKTGCLIIWQEQRFLIMRERWVKGTNGVRNWNTGKNSLTTNQWTLVTCSVPHYEIIPNERFPPTGVYRYLSPPKWWQHQDGKRLSWSEQLEEFYKDYRGETSYPGTVFMRVIIGEAWERGQ